MPRLCEIRAIVCYLGGVWAGLVKAACMSSGLQVDQDRFEFILDGHRFGKPKVWRTGHWVPMTDEYKRLIDLSRIVSIQQFSSHVTLRCEFPSGALQEDIRFYRIGYVGEWNLPTTFDIDFHELTIAVKSGRGADDPVRMYGRPSLSRRTPGSVHLPLAEETRLHVVRNLPKSRQYFFASEFLEVVCPHPYHYAGLRVYFYRI